MTQYQPPRHLRSRLRGDEVEPASGVPVRARAVADPAKAAPDLDVRHLHQLTGCTRVAITTTADASPPPDRAGSGHAAQFPSRRGERLYWPDGRITDLQGNAIEQSQVHRASLLLTVSNTGYWERMRGLT